MDEYVELANNQTLVCVQLEEKEAIKNAEEILQVEGVDVFFVGPSDLSQSMGYPGRKNAAEVQEAIDNTFALINSNNKVSGSAGNIKDICDYKKKDVR